MRCSEFLLGKATVDILYWVTVFKIETSANYANTTKEHNYIYRERMRYFIIASTTSSSEIFNVME